MLLECLTHRLRGHYEGDPAKYREALAKRGLAGEGPGPAPARGAASRRAGSAEDAAAAAERDAAAAVEAAVAFARASPFPPSELAEELVYA